MGGWGERWESLAHFVLRFTKVFNGIGGAIRLNILGIRSILVVSFIC